MSVINYAVLASSLPIFQTMIQSKFQIPQHLMGMATGKKFTVWDGEVNKIYNFVGSWEDMSDIAGEFKIIVINPLTVKAHNTKVVKEWARRSKKRVEDVYKELEQWHHPDSEEGRRLERLKIFKEIGS